MKESVNIVTEFIESNGTVMVGKVTEGHRRANISPGIYVIKEMPNGGPYFLQLEKSIYDIGKIYGKLQNTRAERIQKGFVNSSASVGVLLSGLKGTGKTVLLKLIANRIVEQGLPVISISEPHSGDKFNTFIESLGECMLIFDEFTKTYIRKEEQAQLLTLFDGLNSNKRLTILTSNEPQALNEFFFDRPGRILYHYKFRNLDAETFYGYLDDNLEVKAFYSDIVKTYESSFMYTFDILKTLVHECNMNSELSFSDIIAPLNISDLQEEFYNKVVEICHLGTQKVFTKNDFKADIFLASEKILLLYNILKADIMELEEYEDFHDCDDIYLTKRNYRGIVDGTKEFATEGWTIKLKEVLR